MRQTKRVMTQFCFYDRTGIEKMLEKQAAKGWMLESIGQLGWNYRRTEPRQVHFAVTYYPNASMFDPRPSVGEELYQEFVEHSGWQFVASNAQLQIFCTEAENPVPIETDPMVELQNIHKAVKKSFLPGYYIMLAAATLNLFLMAWRLYDNFTGTLANNANLFTIFCWLALFGMELTEVISYYIWRRKALRAAETDGSFVETTNRNNIIWSILVVVSAALILTLTSITPKAGYVAVVMLVVMFAAVALVLLFTQWMKKTGFSREDNKAYTILATVFISLAITGVATWVVAGIFDRHQEELHVRDTYEINGITFARYGDDVPLTVAELTGEDTVNYSTYKTFNSSILIDQLVANQHPDFLSGQGESLRYVVIEVKFAPLFDFCLREYLTMAHDQQVTDIFGNTYCREFQPIDPTTWGADRAWQLYDREEALTEYLLVYGNRIVNFDFSLEPTQEQKNIVKVRFG